MNELYVPDPVLPVALPADGIGETAAFDLLSAAMQARSADLGAPDALAHMDPATPEIAARLVGLNAALNQNLLHPDLSPFASQAEARVIEWLAPAFGMAVGHMCGGSTIANLAALWCAREHGASHVIASAEAHISVPKAARILGMPYSALPVDDAGRVDAAAFAAADLADAALVLTAGTTGRGALDDFRDASRARDRGAAWVHADAAWAGPLRLTRYADRLAGIESADSVAISAHKWFFQPKDSALVLFADTAAQERIAFGGAYLAKPNIGVQGSRGAAGVALLGTLLAWGRDGLVARIEAAMELADALADRLEADPRAKLRQRPETGVLTWRPADANRTEAVMAALGRTASRTAIDGAPWVRQVAANMHADLGAIWVRIDDALGE